jgi:hypothetical protein
MPRRRASALIVALAALAPCEAGAVPLPKIIAAHYATLATAYRTNRWSLLAGFAAPEYRFVQVDGVAKRIADLERDAGSFVAQGGRISSAAVRLTRVTTAKQGLTFTARVALDVVVPRAGRPGRMMQVDDDRDTWRRSGSRWLLSRSAVASEAITQYGPVSSVKSTPRVRDAPLNLAREYAAIDKAFRVSDWGPVRTFALPGAHFTEVDGSVRTLDQLTAGGRAFFNAGGEVDSAHVRPMHVVRRGDRATVAALASAVGSYPAGAQRLRFMQRSAEIDSWVRSKGRWLYNGGSVLRQTITTLANG